MLTAAESGAQHLEVAVAAAEELLKFKVKIIEACN